MCHSSPHLHVYHPTCSSQGEPLLAVPRTTCSSQGEPLLAVPRTTCSSQGEPLLFPAPPAAAKGRRYCYPYHLQQPRGATTVTRTTCSSQGAPLLFPAPPAAAKGSHYCHPHHLQQPRGATTVRRTTCSSQGAPPVPRTTSSSQGNPLLFLAPPAAAMGCHYCPPQQPRGATIVPRSSQGAPPLSSAAAKGRLCCSPHLTV